MPIHHTHHKKAEKAGYMLNEDGDVIRAFWPERGFAIWAYSSSEAMKQMQAAQAMYNRDYRMQAHPTDGTRAYIFDEQGNVLTGSPMTPYEAFEIINKGDAEWEDRPAEDPEDAEPEPDVVNPEDTMNESLVERSDKGVPLNGGIAYKEKFTAADCPYSSETDNDEEYANFERWNTEFDAAADEAEEVKPGSVVKEEYRARYAEAGHPTHCGDDLAVILNNLCQTTKDGTDLGRFEAICEANGVNLSKYNRTTNGWQGRLRMTGRNMLARKVWENDGVLLTPIEGAEPQYKMSGDWMATRKFAKA